MTISFSDRNKYTFLWSLNLALHNLLTLSKCSIWIVYIYYIYIVIYGLKKNWVSDVLEFKSNLGFYGAIHG